MKKTLLFLFLTFNIFLLQAQNGNQPVTVTDLTKIVQLGTTSFSHNGKWIVFVSKSILPDEDKKNEYTYRTQLWLVPADGSEAPRPFRNG
jgi:Tol biopolymer transport system component